MNHPLKLIHDILANQFLQSMCSLSVSRAGIHTWLSASQNSNTTEQWLRFRVIVLNCAPEVSSNCRPQSRFIRHDFPTPLSPTMIALYLKVETSIGVNTYRRIIPSKVLEKSSLTLKPSLAETSKKSTFFLTASSMPSFRVTCLALCLSLRSTLLATSDMCLSKGDFSRIVLIQALLDSNDNLLVTSYTYCIPMSNRFHGMP